MSEELLPISPDALHYPAGRRQDRSVSDMSVLWAWIYDIRSFAVECEGVEFLSCVNRHVGIQFLLL